MSPRMLLSSVAALAVLTLLPAAHSAGWEAIDRSHLYHEKSVNGSYFPAVILQPPASSEAAFGDVVVESAEWFRKIPAETMAWGMSGIIRPKGETVEDGFEILTLDYFFGMDLWDKTFPYATKSDIEFDVVKTKEVQPGDAIFIQFIRDDWDDDDANPPGIPYDVGTSDVCGVTTLMAVSHIDAAEALVPIPGTVQTLDECWMMSYHIKLSV